MFTADEEEEPQKDEAQVEYELEEISDTQEEPQEEETDVHDAIDAFSQDPSADEDTVGEISEEPEMEKPAHEEEEEQHLPFEDFFNVKPEGVRTNEKISLIPPDEEDDEDDGGVKFKGFFKKKRK